MLTLKQIFLEECEFYELNEFINRGKLFTRIIPIIDDLYAAFIECVNECKPSDMYLKKCFSDSSLEVYSYNSEIVNLLFGLIRLPKLMEKEHYSTEDDDDSRIYANVFMNDICIDFYIRSIKLELTWLIPYDIVNLVFEYHEYGDNIYTWIEDFIINDDGVELRKDLDYDRN